MTPLERVEQRMKDMTWDEAEGVGIEILARCVALHVYSMDEDEYSMSLIERICKRADEWAHEGDNPFVLAMASMGYKHEKEMEKEKTQ